MAGALAAALCVVAGIAWLFISATRGDHPAEKASDPQREDPKREGASKDPIIWALEQAALALEGGENLGDLERSVKRRYAVEMLRKKDRRFHPIEAGKPSEEQWETMYWAMAFDALLADSMKPAKDREDPTGLAGRTRSFYKTLRGLNIYIMPTDPEQAEAFGIEMKRRGGRSAGPRSE